ncbi:NADH:ubiquinone oxidoreductase subunit NDUFA12 [Cereibacter johrii]|uniref:NADH:ubiquinone oxidoreductase subunit n=1 Tax=Cereibacter johrii TaxID=445629 RepID=A0ABX5JDM1_9RHOB|nr:NADH:ubiquinone oxidoreductase subunit NDUFA12 [Cereibacter johrii]RDS94474.1 NADH:ubiquinone oxidoreductase subunit NDUFA12 [Cereibacter sphaeroides f. sp. denitrificans]MEA5160980.1 NADH:ubiquinone oxidoreductase subunit NDUFA12 [Cereibacter johrii]ODM43596.1 NADH dehydrogenase [Cereibacter johrii]PTM80440.1 NADH:ubiquinone oxidoreductase subunit [Cereibacter johrii]RAZ83799.1 NADH:ubiquinone oxidoreductase subunit NDUFA12 [Cereibacter johrii]
MSILKRAITWWTGQSLGTQLFTWRNGVKVGEDEQGNLFYTSKDGKRRWVIYNGEIEASRIGADWHGWLHNTWDEPPTSKPLAHKPWEKPHVENLTGTSAAYAPPGSIRRTEPVARRDYEAWQPE